MHLNRSTIFASAILAILISPASRAASLLPFDSVRFDEARKSGKPVVLQVTATWCGPCQRLRKVVGGLLENPGFKDLVIFDADFDANKDALAKLNAHTGPTRGISLLDAETLSSPHATR